MDATEQFQISNSLQKLIEAVRPPFEYDLGDLIGHGKDPVYLAIRRDTGEKIAVKKAKFRSSSGLPTASRDEMIHDFEKCAKQFLAVASLNHRNIVQYLGLELQVSNQADAGLSLIMEYCSGGTIFRKSHSVGGLSENQVKLYVPQIIEGLVCIHTNGICHLDIKGENIFLTENDTIKIGDFGEIVKLQSTSHTRTNEVASDIGTLHYNAPEMVNADYGRRGRAADIYSFGCVLIEMLTGQMPQYMHRTGSYITDRWPLTNFIGNGGRPQFPPADAMSHEFRLLLTLCLNKESDQRPTIHVLKRHATSWVNGDSTQVTSSTGFQSLDFMTNHFIFTKEQTSLETDDSYNVLVTGTSDRGKFRIVDLIYKQDISSSLHDYPVRFQCGRFDSHDAKTKSNVTHHVAVGLSGPNFSSAGVGPPFIRKCIQSRMAKIDAVFVVFPVVLGQAVKDIQELQHSLALLGYYPTKKCNYRFCFVGAHEEIDLSERDQQILLTDIAKQLRPALSHPDTLPLMLMYSGPITDFWLHSTGKMTIESNWRGIEPFLKLSQDRERIVLNDKTIVRLQPLDQNQKKSNCSVI